MYVVYLFSRFLENNIIMTFEHDESEGWVWRTAYGTYIHLCNMTDLHLENCIKYYDKITRDCTKSRVTPSSAVLRTIDILNNEKRKRKKPPKPKTKDCPFCASNMIFQKAEDPYPDVGWSLKYQYVCECGAKSNYMDKKE